MEAQSSQAKINGGCIARSEERFFCKSSSLENLDQMSFSVLEPAMVSLLPHLPGDTMTPNSL